MYHFMTKRRKPSYRKSRRSGGAYHNKSKKTIIKQRIQRLAQERAEADRVRAEADRVRAEEFRLLRQQAQESARLAQEAAREARRIEEEARERVQLARNRRDNKAPSP